METTAKGEVNQQLETMTAIMVSYAAERFSHVRSRNIKTNYTMIHRATQIRKLRQELRSLRKQLKVASKEEKTLAELRNILKKKLMMLCLVEWHRRRGKERARKRTAFISNPFTSTKKLLGDKRSGNLMYSIKDANSFLHNTLSDPERDQELGPQKALISPQPLTVDFVTREPSWTEVQEIVKGARTASAPGPSGVPYSVYKCCPQLLRHLWKILRVIWHSIKVADQWRCAEGVWIPKEENSKDISQFRSISLLSIEGKIFFSILS